MKNSGHKNSCALPELLSPAGDAERLEAAVRFGANAVYLAGKEFGMRSASPNFSREGLAQAVEYAHKNGVKVHLTCNTLAHNGELQRLPDFFTYAQSVGTDAFIIADVGIMRMAQKYAPKVKIHVSTQAGVVNYETAKAFYELGASRVVLARELRLDEIAEIRAKTPKQL
ncbi:MAG TPA: peptidase U32, partial [Ruminococcaceae bacterium]|nr:peptidase U32 [Oscillospiraceae bacterium]